MLHVCASATLYRPVESQDESKSNSDNVKQNAGQDCPLTNSTYLDSCDDRINKKYIEHLFLEESKNRLNDYYSSKCGKCSIKNVPLCSLLKKSLHGFQAPMGTKFLSWIVTMKGRTQWGKPHSQRTSQFHQLIEVQPFSILWKI